MQTFQQSSNGMLGNAPRLRGQVAFLVSTIAFVVAFSAMSAQAVDSWGYDIAHDLMSPYCPGRTLATCPSPQAAELVQWIVLQETAGATQEQVIEMLVERFGDDILGAPKAEGSNWLAYILPVVGFIAFGGIAFLALGRIVGGDGNAGTSEFAVAESGSGRREAAPPNDAVGLTHDELARIVDGDLESRA